MADRWSRLFFVCVASFSVLFGLTVEQQLPFSWQEKLDLLQLRSSLGLRAKEWPIKSNPCTQWAGIQCTNGRVTGISVSGFTRTRIGNRNPRFSVDALRNLTLLSSFNASNFPMPGNIPDWFGSLPSLRVLDLRSCSIHGAIPFTLGNLSSLIELHLSDNKLTGGVPSSLGQLFTLSALDLSRNLLTGSIPETFSNLGNLTLLDMSLNFLSGLIPTGIGNLSSLQFLNLSGNSFSSSIPAQIGDLSSLIELDLGFNSLSGSVPPEFRGLKNLQRMVLEDNLLSGPLPVTLFPLWTRLRFVVLSKNGFSGEFPDVLWSLPELKFLDVSGNNFTGLMPNIGSIANNNGAVFNISRNLFYGNLTPVIMRFGFIDMSENYFEGPVPIYARGNASLRSNCLRNVTNQRNATDCASFYSDRNLVFDNFGEPNATPPPPKSDNKSHKSIIILSSVLGAALIALVVMIIVVIIMCKRKRNTTPPGNAVGVGPTPAVGGPPPPPGASLNFSNIGDTFTLQQILQAIGEFNDANLIKSGHSGDLYSGKLEGGIPVVIKKIDLNSSVKMGMYMSELDFFSKFSHPRFVPLLGHCLENENEKYLVYKYMPNRDLSSSLFKKINSDDDDSLQSLDWITRLKIAIGAAEGLSYLHHECVPPLVHRDVQASSILLDDRYEVRLGSLSQVCAQEGDITNHNRITKMLWLPSTSDQGASGTLPNATCAYDVYCFGKVLLELVTGKLGISSTNDSATKEFLEATLPCINIYDKELVTNIIDPSLIIDEDLLEEVWAMAIVARSCLNPKPSRRPLMRYILKALENPLKVVREEPSGSERLRATSSRGSWNAALFGSWRHSSSDVGGAATLAPSASRRNERSSSIGRQSKDIFPEPLDVERL
ncbi:hypothetical protein ABFS82_14G114100 [Erythranthe guttata]|uniref:probable LRR receptor-like serine/threonine-protein kinase At2g16250 n=1 Tax=Erythranthe guttata TaxID=4155 RepID=UPI00064DAC08|nr:PREDICTED: probable LRR receptor-like serine/threonine-protein kinase At2g16250 [Erythranthe guttata]|eukprot:XP_012831017.1 PREDICTED: probable LRR receptor-like serine/threonine-protein kinase At2g16250 [Erythranthe guttata]